MFGSRQTLGIDIRDNSLRLAHLSGGTGSPKLLNYLNITLPPLQEGHLSEYETIFVESIRNFVSKHEVSAEQIIIGLPQKDIVFRRIEVPAVKHDEIRQILEFEIERHVPFPLQDIYFDFQVLGSKDDNKLGVALVATRKERANYLLSLLQKANIAYTRLELTTFSLFAGLTFQAKGTEPTGHYLTLDIGFNDVEVGVIQGGKFVFSHRINKQISLTNLASTATANTEETEQTPSPLEKEVSKLSEKLKQQINFLITSLQKNHRETHIEKIFLGGIDFVPTLAKHLQELTQIETVLWNPLQGITSSGFGKTLTEAGVAISLALEGLDLTPHGFNLMPPGEQAAQKKTNSLIFPSILGAIVLLLALGNGASYLIKERLQLTTIEERIAQLQPKVLEVQKATRLYRKLQNQKAHLETISHQPTSLLAVLKELTTKLPGDVWLTRFKMSKGEIEISGFAKTASSLIPVLEDSPLFQDVKFTSTITSKGGGKEKFKLKITLETLAVN